jgi:hypothetical protein
MEKLLKMEKYQFLHNFVYWCGMIGIFVLGFFTADTYVPEVMGPAGGKASSLADIFNGMVYDSTFLLIIISGLLALSFGQEFSGRTITLEVSAGHSRSKIFTGKIISYLIAFHIMALVYPVAGCIREFGKFGMEDSFTQDLSKAVESAKRNEKWRHDYMTLQMAYDEKYREGLETGIQQGIERGITTSARRMLSSGKYSDSEISEITGLSVEQIQALKNSAK